MCNLNFLLYLFSNAIDFLNRLIIAREKPLNPASKFNPGDLNSECSWTFEAHKNPSTKGWNCLPLQILSVATDFQMQTVRNHMNSAPLSTIQKVHFTIIYTNTHNYGCFKRLMLIGSYLSSSSPFLSQLVCITEFFLGTINVILCCLWLTPLQ